MTSQLRLILASTLFAVLWTAGMILWNGPTLAGAIIFTVAGALAGILWFFAMRWWIAKFGTARQ
jgi:hypothetical protein